MGGFGQSSHDYSGLINGTRHVRGKMSEVPVDVIVVGSLLVLHICSYGTSMLDVAV